jgi:hypothetical protein
MTKIIYKPINNLLVRNFLTINYTEVRQLLAPRITSLLFVSSEQKGKQPCRKCAGNTFTAATPSGGLGALDFARQQQWT